MDGWLANKEPRRAFATGAVVVLATVLWWALGTILDEGGGSLSRGWEPGLSLLKFHGLFMIPFWGILGLVVAGLGRWLGNGRVALFFILGIGFLFVRDVVGSSAGAHLSRLAVRKNLPELVFEDFSKGHTFGDGTSYQWVIRCSAEEADALVKALGLERAPLMSFLEQDSDAQRAEARSSYRAIWDLKDAKDVEIFFRRDGMRGGYSPGEQRFRLAWWPEAYGPPRNG